MSWESMATAPIDGTELLLRVLWKGREYRVVGAFDARADYQTWYASLFRVVLRPIGWMRLPG